MECTSKIVGGFSKKACLLWLSFFNPNIRYFEWGSGFTTRVADKIAFSVTSIEGSRNWYEKMHKYPFSNRTTLRYVDIGKTGSFSHPADPTKGGAYFGAANSTHDIFLVDGRWRVACSISAFPFIASNGKLLMHDFTRKHYHPILKFYNIEAEVDGLAVLKPKMNVSSKDLNFYLHRFKKEALR